MVNNPNNFSGKSYSHHRSRGKIALTYIPKMIRATYRSTNEGNSISKDPKERGIHIIAGELAMSKANSTYILELMSANEARAADRSKADDNFHLNDPNNSARGIDMVVEKRRQIT